jgi:hypothetical protein
MGGGGTKKDAFANYGTASNNASQLFGNAGNLYGTLAPELQNQSVNPQGYAPSTLAAMNTANMQTAGGTGAGAAGQGKLYEMRTRNAGAAGNAIAAGAQNAGQQLGRNALQVQTQNANLKEKQQSQAQNELGSLYGTELGAAGSQLGLSNQALGSTEYNPWLSTLNQLLQSGSQVGAAALTG